MLISFAETNQYTKSTQHNLTNPTCRCIEKELGSVYSITTELNLGWLCGYMVADKDSSFVQIANNC